tara:strand:- start:557 stop:1669 length:1113 start_codon:yes stop_codon:yes gene_type:complete
MATFNPIAPDEIYGALQPQNMAGGMRGQMFGPEAIAGMLPTDDMNQRERQAAMQDVQQMQGMLNAARAQQDKAAIDMEKLRMQQESQRMAMRAADINARKSLFDLQKTMEDSKRESAIMQRMPEVLSQLDAIDKDPELNNFQKASEAARLRGRYSMDIGQVPSLGGLFDAYQTSIGSRKASEKEKFERGFRFGQVGFDPNTTNAEFAAGMRKRTQDKADKAEAAIAKEDELTFLKTREGLFSDIEKRIIDLDTIGVLADPVNLDGLDESAAAATGLAGGARVDPSKPKEYTPEARVEAVDLAIRIGTLQGMNRAQIEEFIGQSSDMTKFVPTLKRKLYDLKVENIKRQGTIFGYNSEANSSPNKIGNWGT